MEMSVVLDSPSLAAAPSQPPSTPFVASKVATMWSRSTSASVRGDGAPCSMRSMRRSGPGSRNVGPVAATRARSMAFLKFTSVPGHECEGRRILPRLPKRDYFFSGGYLSKSFSRALFNFFSFFSGLSLSVSWAVPRKASSFVRASYMSTTRVPTV
jgi:hypothetical protein